MFTLDNFWQILNFIDGTSSLLIDSNTQILAPSEQGVAKNLFENTIDQITFASDDYKRLKNFLVNWYSTHRTIITTQKKVNDIFSLPESHLDELFNSFGFIFATTPLSFLTKANFFLDLVNLYKIKGTPESLITVLQYYGLSDIDLAEYWLEKDNTGDLIFRAERYLPPGELNINFRNIDYDVMTRSDPHWRLTKSQAFNLVDVNKIALPSKSPYFSIRPRYNLTLLKTLLSVVQRHVQDDYDTYSSGGTLVRDITLTEININASFLELYLSCDYMFNQLYTHTDSTDDRFYCYDGTSIPNILTVVDQWENRTKRLVSSSLTENITSEMWNNKIAAFYDLFTRKTINSLFHTNDPGVLLNTLHSSLYNVLNSYVSSGNGDQILSYLLKDLNDWIIENIGPGYPNIATTMLGVESLIEINKVIKFFKPYHARLINLDFALIENNPLVDSLVMSDSTGPLGITDIYVDFDVADSSPCCDDDSTAGSIVDCSDSTSLNCSRETYDCGSYFDIGVSIDDGNDIDIEIIDIVEDSLNYHDATSSNAYDYELFVDTTSLDSTADICDGSGVLSVVMLGGWADMDNDGVFDSMHGNDIAQIYIEDFGCIPPTPTPPPVPGAWATTGSLTRDVFSCSGFGDTSDSLLANGSPSFRVYTEIWNGSTWATTTSSPLALTSCGCCGTTSDGLSWAGDTTGAPKSNDSQKWNGSTWTSTSNNYILPYPDEVDYLDGCGTTSDALGAGGIEYDNTKRVECGKWNGSTWSLTGSLNVASDAHSVVGTTTAAMKVFGNTTGDSGNNVDEIWNGSTWATTSIYPINNAYGAVSKNAPYNLFLSFGGSHLENKTYKWEVTWSSQCNLIKGRHFHGGSGGSAGAALAFGGYTASAVDTKTCEKFT